MLPLTKVHEWHDNPQLIVSDEGFVQRQDVLILHQTHQIKLILRRKQILLIIFIIVAYYLTHISITQWRTRYFNIQYFSACYVGLRSNYET